MMAALGSEGFTPDPDDSLTPEWEAGYPAEVPPVQPPSSVPRWGYLLTDSEVTALIGHPATVYGWLPESQGGSDDVPQIVAHGTLVAASTDGHDTFVRFAGVDKSITVNYPGFFTVAPVVRR